MKLDHTSVGTRRHYFCDKKRYVYEVKHIFKSDYYLRASVTYEDLNPADDEIPFSWVLKDKVLDES